MNEKYVKEGKTDRSARWGGIKTRSGSSDT